MFASLTAQKLAHDIDATLAFAKDAPEGVDKNLFEDAKRIVAFRTLARVERAMQVSVDNARILIDNAEHFRRDLVDTRFQRAQKRRAAREEREAAALAQA